MIILALDSTSTTASVSVCSDTNLLAEYKLCIGNTHSETLLPMVESVLKHCSLTPDDIDIFACSEGPGSFTGVRIGASTIKGLAFGKNKPCIGVSTIESLAYNLIGFCGIACPVMNARRGQVYNALFEVNNNEIKRLTPDRAISLTDLEAELLTLQKPIFLSGDGYSLVKESFKSLITPETPVPTCIQSGYSVAMCALEKYNSGVRTTDSELKATYLRLSQAERERNEKLAAGGFKDFINKLSERNQIQ